jgi:6-phosphogluconolactonase
LNVGEGNVSYVALKNANAVAGFSINADGSFSPLAGSPFSAGKGTSSLAGCSCGPGGFLFAANNLDGSISAYSIDATTGVLTQISGSSFLARTPSGDILFVEGELFLPDGSSNAIGGFVPDLSNGVVSAAPGSPFPAGSGLLHWLIARSLCSIRRIRRCAEKTNQQSRVSFWNRWSFFAADAR